MADEVRTYPAGAPFPGVVGRTMGESEAAWPVPPCARGGAPNVVSILLDDVGFAQIGCFGADIRTPTFDRLAAGGLRYRDVHTSAICSPTRACLLTGRTHHADGVGIIQEMATGFPGYNGAIPRENGFLSEVLRRAGYATFAVGPWHLTRANEYASGASKARWPISRGFDRYYGFLGGKTNQWAPTLVSDNHSLAPPTAIDESYHRNADLADRASEFVTDLRSSAPDQPFFLSDCLGAGHAPHHVERRWIEWDRGRFDQGRDRWREDVFARQMEVYAAFLEQTDHHVGRVIAFLEELGELATTLLFVTSDNGASAEGGRHGSFNELQFPNRVEATVEDNLNHLDEWGACSRIRTTPGAGRGLATRRCGAGSGICTRAG